ncbi:DnaJ-containing family protein X-domain [Babesia bovis T2Bo]|uniref:DnaJ domain containing protein n=2 Tax=Babesia bovis TaxID=5865 RepID=A7AUA3_BABBO|nr:DnaJ-containing family protein X-domain [Babesia bovis T2Bo]EDO06514.1 DnaJ-containing family protein X-domain [Babesia bovis T2Bo]|eukprot:XP_001610082.1 DnaJ domain containing protein [Babesia bovis T2Bo]
MLLSENGVPEGSVDAVAPYMHEDDTANKGGENATMENNDAEGQSTLSWLGSTFIDVVVNGPTQVSEMVINGTSQVSEMVISGTSQVSDMVVSGTSQVSSIFQWGDNEENYSLSRDYSKRKRQRESFYAKPATDSDSIACQNTTSRVGPVADMVMYNRLGVESSASKAEIKQAYYKLALRYHPDKNPNDAEANLKFQEISEAYQILYDDESRRIYDAHGVTEQIKFSSDEMCMVFILFFGADALEDYVGLFEILKNIVNTASHVKDVESIKKPFMVEQKYRVVNLAKKLAERLDTHVSDGVVDSVLTLEIQEFCNDYTRSHMVESIGWVYQNCGEYFVAEATSFWGLGTAYSNIQSATRSVSHAMSMARSAYNIATFMKQNVGDENNKPSADNVLGTLKHLTSFILYEIERTIKLVVPKCCKDTDVSAEQRLERAKNLISLGRLMQETAINSRQGKPEDSDNLQRLYGIVETLNMTKRQQE